MIVTGVFAIVDFAVGDENIPLLLLFVVIEFEKGTREEDIF